MNRDTLREAAAEFLGTFTLIMFGVGVVAQVVLGEGKFGEALSINFGWGVAVTLGCYVAGGISGAHLNPAVTLALAIHRGFAWGKVLPYIAAQFAGAFVAAALVYLTYREAIMHVDPELTLKTAGIWATYPQDYLSNVPGGLIDQIVGTALLMMVIFAISDVRNMALPPAIGPIVVGATVFVIGMTYGLNSGYAINPARDLGPRLFTFVAGWGNQVFTAHDGWWWVPVVGPCIGAAVGGLVYDLFITRLYYKEVPQKHKVNRSKQRTSERAAMSDKVFKAGAATSNITPPLGVSINGGMSDRTATHVHDELHARALVLDDGATRIALVVCDSCMIPRTVLDKAKHLAHSHTGIPLDRMTISATHAHSAPTAGSVFQSDPDPAYLEFLAQRISDAIRRAVNNLQPAQVGWGMGSEPTQVFNRRWRMKEGHKMVDPFGRLDQVRMNPPAASSELLEPAGPTDPQIGVLALRDTEGRPLAILANYSLHYVGGVPGGDISADYYGAFAARLAELMASNRLDTPFVGMMSNGTSGNINNINFREAPESRPPYAQIRKVAELCAKEVARVAGEIEYRAFAPLAMRQSQLRLGRRSTPKDEVARAKFVLSEAKGMELTGVEEIYARETVLLNDYPPYVDTLVQAIRIGELGIATTPCETFVETGLAIKAESPLKPTFTIELANDYRGYLPTAEHHALGGYETWRARSSYLEVEAEAKIRRELLKLLGEVAQG